MFNKERVAKMNKSGNQLGNRATRRSQQAFDRKDSRSKKPATVAVMKRINKKLIRVKVNVPAVETKGAFGKRK